MVGFTNLNPSCPSTVDSANPWNVPCSSAELDNRLSIFSQWRGNKGDDGIGLWHLMSGCPTGSEVGIAWLATLYVSKASISPFADPYYRCQQDATGSNPSIVSGTAVSTAGRTEWQVVAHEIGHNFGAIVSNAVSPFGLRFNDSSRLIARCEFSRWRHIHRDLIHLQIQCASGCTLNSSCCPLSSTTCSADARFIMSPVAQAGETVFSPCSLGNICEPTPAYAFPVSSAYMYPKVP